MFELIWRHGNEGVFMTKRYIMFYSKYAAFECLILRSDPVVANYDSSTLWVNKFHRIMKRSYEIGCRTMPNQRNAIYLKLFEARHVFMHENRQSCICIVPRFKRHVQLQIVGACLNGSRARKEQSECHFSKKKASKPIQISNRIAYQNQIRTPIVIYP